MLFTKYYSGDQTKKNEMGGARSTCGGELRCLQILVEESEGKRPLGTPRDRWEYNIKMDLQELGWGHGLD